MDYCSVQQKDCSSPSAAAAACQPVAIRRSSVRTMRRRLQRSPAGCRSWVGTSQVRSLMRSGRGCSRPRCFPPHPQSNSVCAYRPSAMRVCRSCASGKLPLRMSSPSAAAAACQPVAIRRSSVRTMRRRLQRSPAGCRSWVGTSQVRSLMRSGRGCSRPRCFPPHPQSNSVCAYRPSAMRVCRSCASGKLPLRMLCCGGVVGGSEVRMVGGFGVAVKR